MSVTPGTCCHIFQNTIQHLSLQALKQQYTAELEGIQQQQAAAQQALRQRFRRLTGERALGSSNASLGSSADLGASGKSTFSVQGTAQPEAAAPAAVNSTPAQAGASEDSSTYTAQPAAPYSSSIEGVAADSAQSLLPQTSHTGAALSNQPLSASWGEAASLQTTAPDHAQASLEHPGFQPTQQQDFAQNHYSSSSMPQESDSSHPAATIPAGEGTTQLNSTTYSQEPVAQSATDTRSTSAHGGDQISTEATNPEFPSPDAVTVGSEQGGEIDRSQAMESGTPGGVESDQSMSRSLFDSSKPPRPASGLAGQQGIVKSGAVGQPPPGVGLLHDRSGTLTFFPMQIHNGVKRKHVIWFNSRISFPYYVFASFLSVTIMQCC